MTFRRHVSSLIALATLTLSVSVARLGTAEVRQPTPGGIAVPVLNASVTTCSDKNVEVCLDQSEGDASLLNAQSDARISPETFRPGCVLTFKPLTKGGSLSLAFGWYNVVGDPGASGSSLKPSRDDLYAMMTLPDGFQTGVELANVPPARLDLNEEREAGRYADAEIGFWLAVGGALGIDATTTVLTGSPYHIVYTEHAFNPGSSPSTTYYQVLTWQSVSTPHAFYFGWEDLPPGPEADNDFDDLLLFVTGIQCGGGGAACDTGKLGVCADGTLQCQKGELQCLQHIEASGEQCNALDDDCDGEVDEDEPCRAGMVCDRGRCVPRCGGGEFACPGDEACTDAGVCVQAACAEVTCEDGQVCRDGQCRGACDDVVCPYGRTCRNGACIDPCTGIECDPGYSCVLGVCKSCACTPCATGEVCSDNVCIQSACASVSCATGTHCSDGACVDDCEGARCPRGLVCNAGMCVDDPERPDASGPLLDGGLDGFISGTGGETGGNGAGSNDRTTVSEVACACRAAGAGSAASELLLLACSGLLVVVFGRRRRLR
jgi:hypothetical protein